MGSLSRPGVAAVRWSALASAARFGLQLGAQVMLARMLGPQVFGVFAIGLVLLTFASFISGFGFGWSLLQRQELREEDIRFAWTWQMLAGALAGGLMALLAPWLAGLFHQPAAAPVIAWLSLACVLQAAAAPATYLLQRALNFRALGLIQVGSYLVGYVGVGLPLAWHGAGVQALVAAWLTQAATAMLASYACRPHGLKPLLWYPAAAQVMGTGRAVFFTNLVNWALNNLDRLLVARLLSPVQLGLYNVAYNLATVPNTVLLGALQPAFMAAGAQWQDQRARLAAAYQQMLATLLVLALPVFTGLALLAPELVRLLYGAAWAGAGPVLALLFASMPALVIWGISTPVLWNTGRPRHECLLQLPLLPLGALALWLAAPHGITAAAAAAGLLLTLRAAVLVAAALRALALPGSGLAAPALRGAGLSLAVALSMAAGRQLSGPAAHPLAALLSAGLAPLLLAALLLWLKPAWWPALLGAHCWAMLLRFAPGLRRLQPLAAGPMGRAPG
jgi:lipopolysaccharide exporter